MQGPQSLSLPSLLPWDSPGSREEFSGGRGWEKGQESRVGKETQGPWGKQNGSKHGSSGQGPCQGGQDEKTFVSQVPDWGRVP